MRWTFFKDPNKSIALVLAGENTEGWMLGFSLDQAVPAIIGNTSVLLSRKIQK